MKNIVIVGAGPGLGLSIAKKFGNRDLTFCNSYCERKNV